MTYSELTWIERVGHQLSHLFNALIGGDRDETCSCRLGRYVQRHPNHGLWYVRFAAWCLDKIHPLHCQTATEIDRA